MSEEEAPMCLDHRAKGMDRRGFMVALVGVSGTVLVGCVGPSDTGLGLDLASPEQVQQLSRESWQRIRAETPPSTNRTYQQALQKVGTRLLNTVGENPATWEMVVFQGDEANAFALPGGKIGVYEGMFRFAQNEAQLAAVVGHEIGHNQEDHAAERLSSAMVTQTSMQLVSAALQIGNIGYANEVAALLGAGMQYGLILPYSRNQELEADRMGLLTMARAGFDPHAAVALWQNMRSAGNAPPAFLSTHPGAEQRIALLQQLMPQAMQVYRPQ
jgi:predicted Zn-dependent protease